MYDYHQRTELLAEVHSRPFQLFHTPIRLLHLAALYDGKELFEIERQVLSVIQTLGFTFTPDHQGVLFITGQQYAIRYEPHNEFYTLTLYYMSDDKELVAPGTLKQMLPGALMVELEVFCQHRQELLPSKHKDSEQEQSDDPINNQHKIPLSAQYCQSLIMAGAAIVTTDFHIRPDRRCVTILVQDIQLKPAEIGRLLQRLCELETYRHMALLALPIARKLMPEITCLDQQLASIASEGVDMDLSDKLARMTSLAAQVESISAATANRFSASDAYFAMVDRCIRELREQCFEGGLMIGEFMDRHLRPAQRTCNSAAERIDLLSRRIARATELVQSQVNLKIEEQNKALLEAMNTRAQRKMRLESKLESLSVVVVVYYLYDLADLALKNLLHRGEQLELMLTGLTLLLPVLCLAVLFLVRRLMRGYRDE